MTDRIALAHYREWCRHDTSGQDPDLATRLVRAVRTAHTLAAELAREQTGWTAVKDGLPGIDDPAVLVYWKPATRADNIHNPDVSNCDYLNRHADMAISWMRIHEGCNV